MNTQAPFLRSAENCRIICNSKLRSLTSWLMIVLAVSVACVLFYYINKMQERQRAAALAEQSLTSILRETDTAMIEVDSNSKIIFWNKAATKLFGYMPQEVLGQELTVIMPDSSTAASHREHVRRGLESPRHHVLSISCTAKTKSGRTIAVSVNVFVPSNQNSAIALINNYVDVVPVKRPLSQEALDGSVQKAEESRQEKK